MMAKRSNSLASSLRSAAGGSEIEGNRGRPQHPQRDHRNQGLGIVADADADIGSRLDAAQPQLARRLCRSGGKPGIGERQCTARSARVALASDAPGQRRHQPGSSDQDYAPRMGLRLLASVYVARQTVSRQARKG